ncbi:hypothetical protein P6166_14520 [Stenotrophomonas sp. HITSZ_GD]|uniref:hypothetical protein n=1 Tax=Stenotrophomonas sp. HITSZ_GD TaxID=3037248 RepID=UPI00240E3F52|nr:hypothetical protein [Stenotrophomonas sp. HITSZ_GD]MDG2526568.1 hypothetical protein [Stenotrophomonas sp. HITSZ_GD]
MAGKLRVLAATGVILSGFPTAMASVLGWQCRGDGCLGLLLLWIGGGLAAIVTTLALVISGLVSWKREGEFPDETFWWMLAPPLAWGAAFMLVHLPRLVGA